MNEWRVVFTRQAKKDGKRAAAGGQQQRLEELLDVLRQDPFDASSGFEKLSGELLGAYSRRINRQHRLVYRVETAERVVVVMRMWTHYE